MIVINNIRFSMESVTKVIPYIKKWGYDHPTKDETIRAIINFITNDVDDDTAWKQGFGCLFVVYSPKIGSNRIAELSVDALSL